MNIQLENTYKSRIRNRRSHPTAKAMGFPAFVVINPNFINPKREPAVKEKPNIEIGISSKIAILAKPLIQFIFTYFLP